MNYKEKLSQLCSDIDGAMGVFLSTYDGMAIEKFSKKEDVDMDELAAEWSSICSKLMSGSKIIKEVMVTFNTGIIAIKPFENGFIGVVMSPDANLGRAKFELNKLGNDFI